MRISVFGFLGAERIEELREAGVDEFVTATFGSSEQPARRPGLL